MSERVANERRKFKIWWPRYKYINFLHFNGINQSEDGSAHNSTLPHFIIKINRMNYDFDHDDKDNDKKNSHKMMQHIKMSIEQHFNCHYFWCSSVSFALMNQMQPAATFHINLMIQQFSLFPLIWMNKIFYIIQNDSLEMRANYVHIECSVACVFCGFFANQWIKLIKCGICFSSSHIITHSFMTHIQITII